MFTVTIPFSTTADGDAYFAARLYSNAWINASTQDKNTALIQATNIINRFAYLGFKTDPAQLNEWPRLGITWNCQILDSSTIPTDIIIAQFEIAIAILGGIDIEKEIRNLKIVSRGFASVRATYDTHGVPEYLLRGVPSATAWDYLSPYINRTRSENVRVSKV